MTTAAIAYRHLTPAVRASVDDILQTHPAVDEWTADREKYKSELEQGLYNFLRASTWPDQIKRKKGWPNRASWHYADYPLRSPTSPVESDPDRSDILLGLSESEKTLKDGSASKEERAIALSWIIHLIGDLHQPLHCGTAVTDLHPNGDKGGNETFIRVRGHKLKLHAFWDELMGKSKDPSDAVRAAIRLEYELRVEVIKAVEVQEWALGTRHLAQTVAYPPQVWTVNDDEPISVNDSYIRTAKSTGEHQMVVGGERLAAFLIHLLN